MELIAKLNDKNIPFENIILHCMKKSAWDAIKDKEYWGEKELAAEGFIHCSTPEYFWRVAPVFNDISEELVILCIDKTKLSAEVKFEDGDNCGRAYPHIYGTVNNSAVVSVFPFLRGKNGKWLKNPEFLEIENK